jgi:uncharacterized repeat protein (TIGR01451 family)
VWQSDATFSGNRIEDNTTGGSGGGILSYVSNNVILSNNIIQNNRAYGGGGVALVNSGGPTTLTANIIQDNVSRGASYVHHKNGGGVSVGNSNATFIGNIFRRNKAEKNFLGGGGGGGIAVHGGNVILINNIVVDNQATTTGSGIRVVASSPEFYHTTIVSNTGGDGSGIFIGESGDEPGHAILYNSIIANQTVGVKVSSNLALNTATLDGILWWGNASNITGTVFSFDEVAGTPVFVDPVAGDYHIGLGSAAVDVGIDDAGVTDDIDGQTRPHYEGYDLGADEWWPLVAVKTATPNTAEPDDVVTYTLTLTNTTDATMTVCLTDTLPAQVGYLGPLNYNNGSGGYASGVITWTGTVLTATPTLITWPVQVAPDVPGGITITNTANISDAYGLFQTDPALILVPLRYVYLPLVLRNY